MNEAHFRRACEAIEDNPKSLGESGVLVIAREAIGRLREREATLVQIGWTHSDKFFMSMNLTDEQFGILQKAMGYVSPMGNWSLEDKLVHMSKAYILTHEECKDVKDNDPAAATATVEAPRTEDVESVA